MTETPNLLPETPDAGADSSRSDLLSDLLRSLNLSGMVLFRAEFHDPWSVTTPDACQLAQALPLSTEQIIQFHVVVAGECRIQMGDDEPVWLQAGDTVVLPYGNEHVLCGKNTAATVALSTLFPPQPWKQIPVIEVGESGPDTRLICGFLHCDELLFSPWNLNLPKLMHIRSTGEPEDAWLETSIRYLIHEAGSPRPGGQYILARLTELMFIEVLRRHIRTLGADEIGWLAALNDPVTGSALRQLHQSPRDDWTVDSLAKQVGVSRTVLADRFKRFLQTPPMQYLAQLRLMTAARLLRTGNEPLKNIVSTVGYESEAAFNRAFKRLFGVPPARWRNSGRGAGPECPPEGS